MSVGSEEILSAAQLLLPGKIESLGWELVFVRRPMFHDTVPAWFHPHGNTIGVIEDDGTLNTQPDIKVRETEYSVLITCPRCGHMVYGRLWRCPGCGGTGK